ncbi:hypothetical protein [Mycolicibacterium thermoresistibile]
MTDDLKNTDVAETADTDDEIRESAAEETATTPDDNSRNRRAPWLVALKAKVGPILLVVALVAAAALTGWLYFFQYRADQQTDAAAAQVAVDAAREGTVALLSYAPETLEEDFTAARERLTGEFLDYYTEFTEQVVTPAATEKQVSTSANVVRAAVSEIQPDSAVVLVFINQMTTSQENPDGAFAASSVKVGLKKVDGEWLIEAFDPV